MSSRPWSLLLVAATLIGCGSKSDGLVKYPVRGKVLVDGQPEAGVVVRFTHTDPKLAGPNARFPVGVTNGQGDFQLSTNGDHDGAVEGEYQIAFQWPEQDEPPPGDHLGGVYANPAKSGIRAKVEPHENVLETFELKAEKTAHTYRQHD